MQLPLIKEDAGKQPANARSFKYADICLQIRLYEARRCVARCIRAREGRRVHPPVAMCKEQTASCFYHIKYLEERGGNFTAAVVPPCGTRAAIIRLIVFAELDLVSFMKLLLFCSVCVFSCQRLAGSLVHFVWFPSSMLSHAASPATPCNVGATQSALVAICRCCKCRRK